MDLGGGGLITPFKLILLLLIAVTAVHVWRRGYVTAMPRGLTIALLAMLAIIFMSELNSPYGGSAGSLFELSSTVAMYVVMTQLLERPKDLHTISVAVGINLILMAIYVMIEVGWAPLTTGVVRAGGPPGQPNILAENVAREAPFALALLFDRSHRRAIRVLGLVGLLGGIYCLFAAASRGGTVGFIVGIAVFGLLLQGGVRSRVLTMSGLAAATVLMFAFAPKSFDQRVTGSVRADEQMYKKNDVTSERLEHVALAVRMIPQRPWLGYGRMGFTAVRQYETGGRLQALHSALISVMVSYGLPCAALFMGTIITSVVVAIRANGRRRIASLYGTAIVAGIASGVVGSTSSPELFNASLWCLICAGFILHQISVRAQSQAAELEDSATSATPAPDREDGDTPLLTSPEAA
jgi:O-antigen ligase